MPTYTPRPALPIHKALAGAFSRVVLQEDFETEDGTVLHAGLTGVVVDLLEGPPGVAFLIEVFDPIPDVVCVPAHLVVRVAAS